VLIDSLPRPAPAYFALAQPHSLQRQLGWHAQLSPQRQRAARAVLQPQLVFSHRHSF